MTKDYLEAARRYAAADASDPFAFARAVTHLRNGMASHRSVEGETHGLMAEAHYDAQPASEERVTPTGERYTAVVYRNRVRP